MRASIRAKIVSNRILPLPVVEITEFNALPMTLPGEKISAVLPIIEYRNKIISPVPMLSAKAAARPRKTRNGKIHLGPDERFINFFTVAKIVLGGLGAFIFLT